MHPRFRKPTLFALAIAAIGLAACGDDNGTDPDPALTAPTVTATATGTTTISLSWSAVSTATGYVVERAPAGGTFAEIGQSTGTTYDDTGLTAATTYRYRVRAVRGTEVGPNSSEASATTQTPAGPRTATISGTIRSNRTLYADTLYTLSGFVQVADGATLTIEAGTKIQGATDPLGSSLFILRGSRIRAMGTATNPIVFTSSEPAGTRRPGDWGGLILIGNGRINRTPPIILEGTENFPVPIYYSGGTDNTSNSGELHYVRVEFAGFATQPDAELNSFTFAAVGSGTQMDHLQALAGLDDSYEFFGGAVDGKYLVSYESGDDHFDMSEGYVGRLQHLVSFQSKVLEPRPGAGSISSDPRGIENDGCGGGASCPNGEDSEPFTVPLVANFTLVGVPDGVDFGGGGQGVVLRRGTGGYYINGVVTRWPDGAISLRDQGTTGKRMTDGLLEVKNILVSQSSEVFETGSGRFAIDAAANAIEQVATPAAQLFMALPASPAAAADFNWAPAAGSAAITGGMNTFAGNIAAKAGTFVTPTSYRGAAAPTGNDSAWWTGWTNYAAN